MNNNNLPFFLIDTIPSTLEANPISKYNYAFIYSSIIIYINTDYIVV